MTNIPKIKKKIESFLIKEDGKISKKALINMGVIAATIALASATVYAGHNNACTPNNCPNDCGITHSTTHTNQLALTYAQPIATGQHEHCVEQHADSHSDHSEGGWC